MQRKTDRDAGADKVPGDLNAGLGGDAFASGEEVTNNGGQGRNVGSTQRGTGGEKDTMQGGHVEVRIKIGTEKAVIRLDPLLEPCGPAVKQGTHRGVINGIEHGVPFVQGTNQTNWQDAGPMGDMTKCFRECLNNRQEQVPPKGNGNNCSSCLKGVTSYDKFFIIWRWNELINLCGGHVSPQNRKQ